MATLHEPTVSLRELGQNANKIIQELKGSTTDQPLIYPVSRHGEIIGVLMATDSADVTNRELWSEVDEFVSTRDFTRGNISGFVRPVVDSGATRVVTNRGTPTVIMLPVDAAIAEGLFELDVAIERRPADDFTDGELDSFV